MSRKLGPRQLELIEHIKANGNRVNFMKGLHAYFWVALSDPPRLVTFDRVWSLIDRGLLVKVEDDWNASRYELVEVSDE